MEPRTRNTKSIWHGPTWLADNQDDWPGLQDSIPHLEDTEIERRRTHVTMIATVEPFNGWFFSLFAEYNTLIRVTAYCKRFARNLRVPESERLRSIPLTTSELRNAESSIVRLVQHEMFPKEVRCLSKNEPVHRGSRLRLFNPMLTPDGIIRVGGRLDKSDLSDETKHPSLMAIINSLDFLLKVVIKGSYMPLHSFS